MKSEPIVWSRNEITVKVKIKRSYEIRLWIAVQLIRLAALIGGLGFESSYEDI